MMNFADLLLSLVCGFAVSYTFAGVMGETVHAYADGRRARDPQLLALQWLAAFLCGPGLLAERLVEAMRRQALPASDLLLGWTAASGWSALYGFVILSLVQATL